MNASYTTSEAWKALESQDFGTAAGIWEHLLVLASPASRSDLQLDYVFALILQHKLLEAEDFLNDLHSQSPDCLHLHLLGKCAHLNKKYGAARAHYLAEQAGLKASQPLAQGWNTYAIGSLALEQHDLSTAVRCVNQSLTYAREAQDNLALGCSYRLLSDISQALGEDQGGKTALAASKHAFSKLEHPLQPMNLDKRALAALLQLSPRAELRLSL